MNKKQTTTGARAPSQIVKMEKDLISGMSDLACLEDINQKQIRRRAGERRVRTGLDRKRKETLGITGARCKVAKITPHEHQVILNLVQLRGNNTCYMDGVLSPSHTSTDSGSPNDTSSSNSYESNLIDPNYRRVLSNVIFNNTERSTVFNNIRNESDSEEAVLFEGDPVF